MTASIDRRKKAIDSCHVRSGKREREMLEAAVDDFASGIVHPHDATGGIHHDKSIRER